MISKLFLALLLIAPGLAAEDAGEPDKAPVFTLEDQFEKSHTFDYPREIPLVFSVADLGGATDAPVWTDTIKAKYGGRIEFRSIANLSFMPGVAKGAARLGIRTTSNDVVLCDWDGKISEGLKAIKGKANIVVISIDGKVLHRVSGQPDDEKFRLVYAAIDSALDTSGKE